MTTAYKKRISFMTILLTVSLIFTMPVMAADIVVSSEPDKENPSPAETVTVAVDIDLSATTEVLAEYTVEVRWDPSVLDYQSVSGGSSETFAEVDAVETDTPTGVLQLSWFDLTGSGGDLNVAQIVYTVVGAVGEQTSLDVVVSSLSASNLDDLYNQHTVSAGIVTVLGPPSPVSPTDMSYIPAGQEFSRSWTAVANATSYEMQESLEASFATVEDTQTVSVTEYTASYETARTAGSPVYWRIRARVGGVWGDWSEVWSFYTDLGSLELLAPDDLAYVEEDVTFSYRWSTVLNATEYQLVAGDDATFAGLSPTVVTGTALSASISGEYTAEAPWYWRVRTKVDDQYGEWSETRRVVTRAVAYAPPTDLTVSDVIGDHGHSLQLSWALSSDDAVITDYQIFRSRSAEPDMNYVDIATLTTVEELLDTEATTLILIASVSPGVSEYTDESVPLNNESYYYWMMAVSQSGASKIVSGQVATSVDEFTPAAFSVGEPFPNPFNASVAVEYSLASDSQVTVAVYDILGRQVAMLQDEMLSAGQHRAIWLGLDSNGETMASGVYFLRVDANGLNVQRKISFVR